MHTREGLWRRRHWLLLGLVFAAHGVANAVWISRDLTLRSMDGGPHLEVQSYFFYLVQQYGLEGLWQMLRGGAAGSWPSAGYLPWVTLDLLFGQHLYLLRLSNLGYLALVLVSTFLLGRRLHSPAVGLLAAALVSLFPAVYGESRQVGADFPGLAMTTLCMALLLSSEGYSRRRAVVLLGLAAGLGVLVRPHVLFFLVVPCLAALAQALVRPHRAPRGTVLINVLLGGLVAGLVSAVWWGGNVQWLLSLLKIQQVQQGGLDLVEAVQGSSALFYLKTVPWCFSPLLLVVAAASLVGLAKVSWAWRSPRSQDPLLVAAWLVGSLIILASLRYHFLRFLLPLCPALALLMALGLVSLPHRASRRAIILITLVAASFSWMLDSFNSTGPLFFGCKGEPLDSRKYSVTSGPPAQNPVLLAAARAADKVRQAHGTGRGVVLRTAAHPRVNALRFIWLSAPMLGLSLPGIQLSGVDHHLHFEGHRRIGGAGLPHMPEPVSHCYLMAFSGNEKTASDPRPRQPALQVFETLITPPAGLSGEVLRNRPWWLYGYSAPLRITLWRYGRCPADILQEH